MSMSFKRKLLFVIVFLGIFLRANEYFENRSLWFDEINVSNQLKDYSIAQIIKNDPNLGYPAGFVAIEKAVISVFGNNELALRFFPLVCGILSLLLFVKVIGKFGDIDLSLIAVTLFSFSFYLIYYSNEAKPYSADVLMSVILIDIFIGMCRKESIRKDLFIYILLGAVGILFSVRDIIALISAGLMLLMCELIMKNKEKAKALAILNLSWILALALYYVFALKYFFLAHKLKSAWLDVFIPAPNLFSLEMLKWIPYAAQSFVSALYFNRGLSLAFLFIGMSAFVKKSRREAAVIAGPVIFTFILGILGYPLFRRLVLFLFPYFIILISMGIIYVGKNRRILYKGMFIIVLTLILSFLSLNSTALQLAERISHEDTRPLLEILQKNMERDDKIYVFYGAKNAFDYYNQRFQFKEDNILLGARIKKASALVLQKEVNKLARYKRVWIFVSHVNNIEDRKLIYYVKLKGGQIKKHFGRYPRIGSAPFTACAYLLLVEF